MVNVHHNAPPNLIDRHVTPAYAFPGGCGCGYTKVFPATRLIPRFFDAMTSLVCVCSQLKLDERRLHKLYVKLTHNQIRS